MKIYLAARYSRRQQMVELADELERIGHTVTSRWVRSTHDLGPDGRSRTAPLEKRARIAQEDLNDLRAADLVVSFTEDENATASRGGRHVEFGVALALGKRLFVVGQRENVFHTLPEVEWCANQWVFVRWLGAAEL